MTVPSHKNFCSFFMFPFPLPLPYGCAFKALASNKTRLLVSAPCVSYSASHKLYFALFAHVLNTKRRNQNTYITLVSSLPKKNNQNMVIMYASGKTVLGQHATNEVSIHSMDYICVLNLDQTENRNRTIIF